MITIIKHEQRVSGEMLLHQELDEIQQADMVIETHLSCCFLNAKSFLLRVQCNHVQESTDAGMSQVNSRVAPELYSYVKEAYHRASLANSTLFSSPD